MTFAPLNDIGADVEKTKRKNNRLEGYDYGHIGAYFVTMCTKDKKCVMWDGNGLSEWGKAVDMAVNGIEEKYPSVKLKNYAVMPNHVHLLLFIGRSELRCRMSLSR